MKRLLSFLLALLFAGCASAQTQNVTVQPNGTGTGTFNTRGITYYLFPAGSVLDITQGTLLGGAVSPFPSSGAYTLVANPTGGTATPTGINSGIYLGAPSYSDVGVGIQQTYNQNTYEQDIIQNKSNGASASADYIVGNDQNTASTHYGDFGINSSGYVGTGSLNIPGATYLYAANGDLAIGTFTSNAIHFFVNNGATDAMTISTAGVVNFANQPTGITSSAGGTNQQVQYNNSGALGGIAGSTWNGTTLNLPTTSWNGTNASNYTLTLNQTVNGVANSGAYSDTSTLTSGANGFQLSGIYIGDTAATGTFTGNAYNGIYINTPSKTGTGTITSGYMLNVQAPVAGMTGYANFGSEGSITSTGLNGMPIGATTASTGAFTTLASNSTGTFSGINTFSSTNASAHLLATGVGNGAIPFSITQAAMSDGWLISNSVGVDGVTAWKSAQYGFILGTTGNSYFDSVVSIYLTGDSQSNGLWIGKGGAVTLHAGLSLTKTIAGSTGAVTQNTSTGEVQFAGSATSLVVTNSLCSSTSIITATICTNDATAVLGSVVKASGSFTINMKTAPTGTTLVDYRITN